MVSFSSCKSYQPQKFDTDILFLIIYFSEIDEINILQATMLAMKSSIDNLLTVNSNQLFNEIGLCYALIDGNKCPNKLSMKSRPVVRGDAIVYPIALASIVAKVERDHMMVSIANFEIIIGNDIILVCPWLSFIRMSAPSSRHQLFLNFSHIILSISTN